MLLCNYVFLLPLVPPLLFPSSVATVSSPSVSVVLLVVDLVRELLLVVDIIVVVVHLVPCCWWRSLLALAMRRAWSVVTPLALATVDDPEEVNVASRHFQFRLCPLLRLLHCHDHDTVALHVPHTSFIPHLVLCWIIMFVDGGGSAHALPP